MTEFYDVTICGLTRRLPIKPVSKNTQIASLDILGDVELIQVAAKQLAEKLSEYEFDFLVGPEVKVVPLIYELAKLLGHSSYIICRKSIKPSMVSPIVIKPLSYFPKHVKPLVIDGADANKLKGKKVVIIDDVVSTGVTIRLVNKLMENIGAQVVATAAIIRQGESQFDQIDNFIYLGTLPIFKTGNQP